MSYVYAVVAGFVGGLVIAFLFGKYALKLESAVVARGKVLKELADLKRKQAGQVAQDVGKVVS